MTIFACLLGLAACQDPAPVDPLSALGIDADVQAVVRQLRLAPTRHLGPVPELLIEIAATPPFAVARAEREVRAALAELKPLALVRAAGRAYRGVGKEARLAPRLDLRSCEDALERAHREVLQAIGPGRDPTLFAPELQAVFDRILHGAGEVADADKVLLRQAVQRAAKIDYAALQAQAAVMVQAALLLLEASAELQKLPTKAGENGVTGTVLIDRGTPFGRFVVGGPGRNEYACEQLAVIIDLGGDDTYRGPAGGAGFSARFSMVVDAAGNDRYEANNDGLGSATLGVGVLLDLAGDDTYLGRARCLGYGLLGVGVCLDLQGADTIELASDGGGVGCLGLGLCADLGAGKDTVVIGARGCGVGLPGGLGMFVDDGGDDERALRRGTAAGAAGFGFGFGLPGHVGGGCGVFVDVDGNDRYAGGEHACGSGWHGGGGVFFDAAGRDSYRLGALTLGSARDGGFGIAIDAHGDDVYELTAGPAVGAAFGFALGWFEDRAGADRYTLAGEGVGFADAGGLGVCRDLGGKDHYVLTAQLVPWRNADATKAVALAVLSDAGAEADEYPKLPGRVLGDDVRERRQSAGPNGDVVRVFADR